MLGINNKNGGYDIQDLTIIGSGLDGCYGIGNLPGSTGGGMLRLKRLKLYRHDIAIHFDQNYENNVGLDYDNIYIQVFNTCGMNLGSTTGNSGGQSDYCFNNIVTTNAGANGIAYISSVTPNSPDATHDTITWSGVVPLFGFVVMRSANGTSGWEVPPNWYLPNYQSPLRFAAAKTFGERWYYAVVRNTIGINLFKGNHVSMCGIQTEETGIGVFASHINSINIQNHYSERRDTVPPRSAFCSVLFDVCTGASLYGAYSDGYGYVVGVMGNTTAVVENIWAAGTKWSVIGTYGATLQVPFYRNISLGGSSCPYCVSMDGSANFTSSGEEVSAGKIRKLLNHVTRSEFALQYRGKDESVWYYDAIDGAVLAPINKLQVVPNSKTVLGLLTNTTQFTGLMNNTPSEFLTLTLPSVNMNGGVIIGYSIGTVDTESIMQNITGQLFIAIAGAGGGTVRVTLNKVDAIARQNGAVLDVVFSTSVNGSVVTISACVNNSGGASSTIAIVVIADLIGCTSIVQS
jgi:hypothetical protein